MSPAMNLMLHLDLVLLSLLTMLLFGVSLHQALRAEKRREKERKAIQQHIGALERANRAAAARYA